MMRMKWLFAVGVLLVLGIVSKAHAQLDSQCNDWRVNAVNSGADVTIDNTGGGVQVLAGLSRGGRCEATIRNTGAAAMRCGPATGPGAIVVDATHGTLLSAGDWRKFGFEGWVQINCIRTTGSSTTAAVDENRRGGVQ